MIRNTFFQPRHCLLCALTIVIGFPVFAQNKDKAASPDQELVYRPVSATEATSKLLKKHRKRSVDRASALYQFGLGPDEDGDDANKKEKDEDDNFRRLAPFVNNAFTSYGVTPYGMNYPFYGYGGYGYGGYGYGGYGGYGCGGVQTNIFFPTRIVFPGSGPSGSAPFFTPPPPRTIWRTNVPNPRSPFSMGAIVREGVQRTRSGP